MRKNCKLIYLLLLVVSFSPFLLGAQFSHTVRNATIDLISNDSIPPKPKKDTVPLGRRLATKHLHPSDSISENNRTVSDSLAVDSLSTDTAKTKKSYLDAVVEYSAEDSIVMVMAGSNHAFLYGNSNVKYTTLNLTSEKISMSLDSSIAHATYGLDSVGEEFGYPLLNENGTDYEAKTMDYNFKTKKGYLRHGVTQQGEGYVVGEKIKKSSEDAFFMADGRYTTCDEHEHPHFYFALTKAKVRPGKNTVTGPAYLVIEDLPLPIAVPFGFFPFTSKYSSGVIMPSYADDMDRGFGLTNGGYYFALSDYMDLAVTGEIYTKGSWALNARSTYRKRYQYSGSFDVGYLVTKISEKGLPDYSLSKDTKINWTHSQDAKANTYRTLSASVNYSTSTYDRNSVNSIYSNNYSNNTKGSSISLTQRFPNSPLSLSASMNVNQRSQDSSISVTLPNLTVTLSRIKPFKRKEAVGAEKWYEKIQLSYTGDLRNSIDTKDNLLFKSNLQKDWKHAMKHSIPISATFSLFDNINVTPSVNYTERWYTSKISKDVVNGALAVADTTHGFYRVFDFNTSLSFQTKMYGMYTPVFSKSTQIRHVFTPSVSFGYAPDFSAPVFGYYTKGQYYDANGDLQDILYSPFEQGMFGVPSAGKQGSVNFSFENNLEMKMASDKDSTGYKKISLIDNLGISFSHNFMAEEFKWSDISMNVRLKLSKSLTFNISSQWDPYTYQYDEKTKTLKRQDVLRIQKYGTIARLRSTSYSISPSINQDTFKKWFGGGDEKKKDDHQGNESLSDGSLEGEESADGGPRKSLLEKKKDDGNYDEDGYLKNELKWNLAFNFSMSYGYDQSRTYTILDNEYKGRITKNFGLSGAIQPTKNWNFTFSSSYDFDAKKFADLYCTLTRNLHCWSISANFRPVGLYKSYFVTLRASSSMLQDLKYENKGRTSTYDPNWD